MLNSIYFLLKVLKFKQMNFVDNFEKENDDNFYCWTANMFSLRTSVKFRQIINKANKLSSRSTQYTLAMITIVIQEAWIQSKPQTIVLNTITVNQWLNMTDTYMQNQLRQCAYIPRTLNTTTIMHANLDIARDNSTPN